jgi:hypothetical protein
MTYLMNEETLGMGDAYDKSLQQARVDTISRATQMISLGQSIEGSATISPFSRKESILLMTAMVSAL